MARNKGSKFLAVFRRLSVETAMERAMAKAGADGTATGTASSLAATRNEDGTVHPNQSLLGSWPNGRSLEPKSQNQ